MSPKDGRAKEISQRRDQIARSTVDVLLNGQAPSKPPPATRGTEVPSGPDLDHAGAVVGVAIFSFNSVQVLRTSAVISEQSSI
jgi:hypothetical protein